MCGKASVCRVPSLRQHQGIKMNLVAIAALIAVCGAAKLDRTYLPPASAKTAGGSDGSLQTPFSGNSLNNGLGGLPKGSYTNDFQGVVVDAATSGTRASGEGETGLGAPRISYGSTNSKVGAAAFKVGGAAFGQDAQVAGTQNQGFQTPVQAVPNQFGSPSQSQFGSQNQLGSQSTQSQNQFGNQPAQSQFGSQNQNQFGSQATQSQNQFGSKPQNQFPSGQNQFGSQDSQNQFSSQADQSQFGNQAGQNIPERARAALDRAATTIRFENEVGPESFRYAFETDNGISAEENGVATNGVQAQGAFSYTGDDGKVYSLTYTADEGGYQPQGDHLPTPPPIPEEILKSLEKNARDEAAGLVDDGSYDAQKYNAGSDYAESDNSNGKYSHQSSVFGNTETDATASGTFISPNNQPFKNPAGQSRPNDILGRPNDANGFAGGIGQNTNADISNEGPGQFGSASNGLSGSFGTGSPSNGFTASSTSAGFGQPGLSGNAQGSSNGFGTSNLAQGGTSGPGLANNKEYLPPVNNFNQNGRPQGGRPQNARPQNGRPQNGRPQNGRPQVTPQGSDNLVSSTQLNQNSNADVVTSPDFQQNGQNQGQPQGSFTSSNFDRPSSGQNIFGSVSGPSSQNKPGNGFRPNSGSTLSQGGITSQIAGNAFENNKEYLPPVNQDKFGQNRPQRPNGSAATSQINQQYTQTFENNPAPQPFGQSQGRPSSFGNVPSSLAPTTGSHGAFGSQTAQQFNGFQKPQSNGKPNSQNGNGRFPSQINGQAQSTPGFNLNSQQATSQPDTELTTPFETSGGDASRPSQDVTSPFGGSRPNGRPGQSQFVNSFNSQGDSSIASSPAFPPFGSPSSSRPGSTSAPFGSAPTQASGFTTPSPQEQIDQNQFNQELQFGNKKPQPQSAFSSDDVQYSSSTQRPTFTLQAQGPDDSYYYDQPSKPFGVPQGSRFPGSSSNQFGRPQRPSNGQNPIAPTFAPTAFPSQNGQFQGSKYPSPPTLPSAAPTSSSQNFQGNAVSGITQAAISSFPSAPTQSTQLNSQGQFGSQPGFQGASSSKPDFGQSSPTRPSFGQQPIPGSQGFQRPGSQPGAFPVTQNFGQQPEAEDVTNEAQSVSSQQYQGEIYEYKKPAQPLPPPDSKDAASIQFGQKVQGQFGSKPQPGQKTESSQTTGSQFGQQAQPTQGSRPQFGGQSSRPQFGQTSQAQSSFGVQSSQSEPSSSPFGKPQFTSPQGNKPQFGAQRPFSQSQTKNEDSEEAEIAQGTKPTGFERNAAGAGRPSSCCRPSGQFGPVKLTKGSQEGPASQLGLNSGFPSAPTSSFSGKGEAFGGPRKPPSYDDETGYHY